MSSVFSWVIAVYVFSYVERYIKVYTKNLVHFLLFASWEHLNNHAVYLWTTDDHNSTMAPTTQPKRLSLAQWKAKRKTYIKDITDTLITCVPDNFPPKDMQVQVSDTKIIECFSQGEYFSWSSDVCCSCLLFLWLFFCYVC